MILSLFAGLDLDLDVDVDDGGGLGLLKGTLTFISFGSYVIRAVLISTESLVIAVGSGIVVGGIAVILLSLFVKWLLSNQSETNYSLDDALYAIATVYLRIGPSSTGIIRVNIKGVDRELKAASSASIEIPTGSKVLVERIEGEIAYVTTDID